MSGKGKTNRGLRRTLSGVGATLGLSFLLLCIAAWLMQKGSLAETLVHPVLAVTAFAASLTGCAIVAYGEKEKRGIVSAAPGLILAAMILAGRWIAGKGGHDLLFLLLLVVCTAAPALFVGLRRPRKRRR